MTTPWPTLEQKLESRMRTVDPKRPGWFRLRVVGICTTAFLFKAGAIAGFAVVSPVIVGFWVCRKVRRAGK